MVKRKRSQSSCTTDAVPNASAASTSAQQRARSRITDIPYPPRRVQFADLSIRHDPTNPTLTRVCVQHAIDMGYDCVCIDTDIGNISIAPSEQVVADEPFKPKRRAKASGASKMRDIPRPYTVDPATLDTHALVAAGRVLLQFSRLTCTIDDDALVHAFCHDRTAQSYDVVAVRPLTEQVLTTFSTKAEAVDLLSFDAASETVPWLFRGKVLRRVIDEAGLSIELQYACALDDSESRRKFLCNARQLLCVTSKAKGVVLSSGCRRPMQQRGPYDAANLLALVDAPAEYAKRMISCLSGGTGRRMLTHVCFAANCERVLLRARARTSTVKGVLYVRPVERADAQLLQALRKVGVFAAELSPADERL